MNKKEMWQYISEKSPELLKVSDDIWDIPETAFLEYKSVKLLCEALEREGFQVEKNIAGIETAFIGKYGHGQPVIGFLGEYDALAGLSQEVDRFEKLALEEGGNGHGCGHNLLGVGSLMAAVGLKKYLSENKKSGTIIYYGCPGEEGGSGKAFMAKEGVFDNLDIALTWHPKDYHGVWADSSNANYQIYYKFKGISSHAATSPEEGRSALDAVELMNTGVQYLREHIIQEARIHYAITNTGGFSPNVVQAYAEVLYLIRAPKIQALDGIYNRVNDIAKGAALMTGTQLEIDFVKGCSNLLQNNVIEEVIYKNLQEAEIPKYNSEEIKYAQNIVDTISNKENNLKKYSDRYGDLKKKEYVLENIGGPINTLIVPYEPSNKAIPGSTDVGDVTWICPTGQVLASTWAANTPGHSWQVVAQGKSSIAHKGTLYAAQVMAGTAVDFIDNPRDIQRAKEELEKRLGGSAYKSPIPDGVRPRSIGSK